MLITYIVYIYIYIYTHYYIQIGSHKSGDTPLRTRTPFSEKGANAPNATFNLMLTFGLPTSSGRYQGPRY